MTDLSERIAKHYSRGDLAAVLLDALGSAGKNVDALTPDDLHMLDEFHIRGRAATEDLAAAAGVTPECRVLDLGCGIGGPSRYLAATYGCRVTGVDLSQEYCEVAAMLAERTGLAQRADYRHADALQLPFENRTFDLVWTQHATMNIADKPRLFGEIARVLRPGGRLALYDVVAGPGGPPHFPVPWAASPEISFLLGLKELRTHLDAQGFGIVEWQDETPAARSWFGRMRAAAQAGATPPLGIHVLVGDAWPERLANMVRNLDESRVGVVRVVAYRPD